MKFILTGSALTTARTAKNERFLNINIFYNNEAKACVIQMIIKVLDFFARLRGM